MSNEIQSKTWIGWVITILLSVGASWASMNTRVYSTESDLQVLKTRLEILEKSYDKLLLMQENQARQYSDISGSLIRIEETLKTKQDRRYEK
jgi:hypothetical protein